LQPFIDANQDYFDAEVRELDFNRADAKDIINDWIEDKTNDLIKDVIKEVSPQTVMFLINAIYFKGTWKFSFDEELTENQSFQTYSDGNVTAPTMQQQALLNYYENDLFQSVELPYGDEKFNMILFLPNRDKTTNDVISEMNDSNWDTWTSSLTKSDSVVVYLPKFKIEYDAKLKENLINLGMGNAFTSGLADFSNMTPVSVYISEVIHQSFVEVNEEGTEAAAVTVVVIDYTSAGGPETIEIKFDRPFVFAIYEKSTNAILFLGEVLNPTL
jgi:serine protease inhibitor